MKVKFLGEDNPIALRHGKEYEVMSVAHATNGVAELYFYQMIDETDEDYYYVSDNFEVVNPYPEVPSIEWLVRE